MERTLDLTYDKLIIGADLSALCYSYVNSTPIIYLRHLKPYKRPYDSHHFPYDDDINDNNSNGNSTNSYLLVKFISKI